MAKKKRQSLRDRMLAVTVRGTNLDKEKNDGKRK